MKKAIVTVCLNSGKTIERTFLSVSKEISRTNQAINYIVIDGGSTDDTLSLIEKWKGKGLISQSISEKDSGIYNAMNKGVKLVNDDEYTVFLNSDDELHEGALEALDRAYANNPSAAFYYGDALIVRKQKNRVQTASYLKLTYSMICNHQALWVKGEHLKSIEGFKEDTGLAADADLILRLCEFCGAGQVVKAKLAVFHTQGITSQSGHQHNILDVLWDNRVFLKKLMKARCMRHAFQYGAYKKLRRMIRKGGDEEAQQIRQIAAFLELRLSSNPRLYGVLSQYHNIVSRLSLRNPL